MTRPKAQRQHLQTFGRPDVSSSLLQAPASPLLPSPGAQRNTKRKQEIEGPLTSPIVVSTITDLPSFSAFDASSALMVGVEDE